MLESGGARGKDVEASEYRVGQELGEKAVSSPCAGKRMTKGPRELDVGGGLAGSEQSSDLE